MSGGLLGPYEWLCFFLTKINSVNHGLWPIYISIQKNSRWQPSCQLWLLPILNSDTKENREDALNFASKNSLLPIRFLKKLDMLFWNDLSFAIIVKLRIAWLKFPWNWTQSNSFAIIMRLRLLAPSYHFPSNDSFLQKIKSRISIMCGCCAQFQGSITLFSQRPVH